MSGVFKLLTLIAVVVFVAFNLNCFRCDQAGERLAEKIAEKAIEKETGEKAKVDIDKGEGKITIEGKEGKAKIEIGKGADLAGLPPELVYPNAISQGSIRTENDENKIISIGFSSKDKLTEIENHYAQTLKNSGWVQKARAEHEDEGAKMVMVTYEKGKNKMSVTISSQPDEDETEIAVMYAEPK